MKYNITIDQNFAREHDLTLTQASCLSAAISILSWANTLVTDGKVYYQYSESKMCEYFPVLFGCAKRAYKNLAELETLGFLCLKKIGKTKYLTLTDKCRDWGEAKSPKTDSESENGLKIVQKRTENSPKMDADNNINNYNINNNITKARETKAEREAKFREKCDPYRSQYGDRMIDAFIFYWTEGENKMRFEKQDVFEVSRRLATWARREAERNPQPQQKKVKSVDQIMREHYGINND